MNAQSIKTFSIAIGILVLQVAFFNHLKIYGVKPDVVLLFLIWYMTKSTRTAAILMAAFLGFSQDALLDVWGLNMLVKILIVFVTYPWVSKNLKWQLQLPGILTVVLVISLAFNLLIIAVSLFIHLYTAEYFFWRNWLGNSLYTTLIAGIIQLFRMA